MQRSYDEFIERIVKAQVTLNFEDAERASVATLSTLSEMVSPEAAKNLGSHLPAEMVDKLDYRTPDGEFEPMSVSFGDFLDEVGEKEGTGLSIEEVRLRTITVMKAVRECYGVGADLASLSEGLTAGVEETELNQIREELGEGFEPLFH